MAPPQGSRRLSSAITATNIVALLRRSPVLAASHLLSDPSLISAVPNPTLNSLLRSLSSSHHLNLAIRLYSLIPTPHPSPHTSNTLLHCLLIRNRTRMALTLFSRLIRLSVLDLITLNTLLRGLCLNSRLTTAFRVFSSFNLLLGKSPDIVSYNILLDGVCRAGEIHIACKLFDQMPERNIVSYTTLIRGFCKKQLSDKAIEIFNRMISDGVKPNKITYNTLIQGLCEAKRMDLVKEIMEKDDGFKPDTCTFNTLIAAHCSMGRFNDALKVFDKMLDLHVKRDSASFSTIMRALCEAREFVKVEKLVDELLEKEVFKRRGVCTPLMAAYNPVFDYLCKNGKANKARMLIRQLLERRAKIDIVSLKIVILGHCKEGDYKEGYELLLSMIKRDLNPDEEVYISLIKGFLRNEKWFNAYETLERMLNSGHRPRTEIFHLVLEGLLKSNGFAKEASELIDIMFERKIRQNLDLSTETVTRLFREGLNDKALELIKLIYANGYYVKVEKLVKSLCEASKFLEAREILMLSLETRQRFDLSVSIQVIEGLCRERNGSVAFELFYELLEQGFGDSISSDCLEVLQKGLEKEGKLRQADFVRKQIRNNLNDKQNRHERCSVR